MTPVHPTEPPRREALNLSVLSLFAVFLIATYWRTPGMDLTSSYLGCRLFVTGQSSHLYGFDASLFNTNPDPVWSAAAQGHGLPELLPPYVQTPLWGYALQPLCAHIQFPAFNRIFLMVTSFCLAGMIWLTARYWASRLYHPSALALLCIGFWYTKPLREAMYLVQTHILFLLMALAAVVLARRRWPVTAGVLLALAAAVKITPAILVYYWFVTRQLKAALTFCITSALVLGVTLLACGWSVVSAWIQNMGRVSNVLLVANNNDSLAAWWMASAYPASELNQWHNLTLPPAVKIVCLLLYLASGVAGGYFDRQLFRRQPDAPPYGAVFTLLAGVVFTPIAWSHYYILLVVPVMLLLDESRQPSGDLASRAIALAFAAIITSFTAWPVLAIELLPRVQRHLHLTLPDAVPVRGQFYAGVMALAALVFLYLRGRAAALQKSILAS